MTQKVHGAAYAGIWVEKQVTFIKLTFNVDISALPFGDLVVLGTATPAGAGTVADSSFAVVESALVSALKTLATRSTILAISEYNVLAKSVDVMLGHANAWFSAGDATGAPDALTGLITPVAVPVIGAQAVVTTPGAAPTNVLGATVGVIDTAVTFTMNFVHMDGTMPLATSANGGLVFGPGSTPGNAPPPGNTPTGTPGWYPKGLPY